MKSLPVAITGEASDPQDDPFADRGAGTRLARPPTLRRTR
jgi:hypothetical protein